MTMHYLQEDALLQLLGEPPEGSTFAPAGPPGCACLEPVGPQTLPAAFSQSRSPRSPKGFLLPPAESVGRYGGATPVATETSAAPIVLVGLRACELRALRYLDKVMLDGAFEDPLYHQRRRQTTVVSCDCVDCAETCFCPLVGGKPFPEEGYDVNLTALGDGFLAEVATDRGRRWIASSGAEPPKAAPYHLAARDKLRRDMTERLLKQNAGIALASGDQAPGKLPDENDEGWQRFSDECVECGACTNICPTCYCFYLYDQALGDQVYDRARNWDSCLLSSYHRMAGGAGMKLTPRPRLHSRLANRVLHKFVYSPQQHGVSGCVGCGRCIEACPGMIDIRQVVAELSK